MPPIFMLLTGGVALRDFSLVPAWASAATWKISHRPYQMDIKLKGCSFILGVLCLGTEIRKTLFSFNDEWHT